MDRDELYNLKTELTETKNLLLSTILRMKMVHVIIHHAFYNVKFADMYPDLEHWYQANKPKEKSDE